MIGIEYFLFGYFTVSAPEEKLSSVYNLFLARGIGAKKTRDGKILIRKKHHKEIEGLLREAFVDCSEIKGLPRFIYQNRKRYGVFAALAFCTLCFLFVSGRVWEIRIQGVADGEKQEILSALGAEGLSEGVPFRSLDFSAIENGLQNSCASVAWANVHRRGTVVYVNVIAAQAGQSAENTTVGNLVASEDSVIVEVSPDSGVSCVKVGDTVRAGDILVSAVHPDGTLSGASGVVKGRVSGEITAHAAMQETKTVSKEIQTVGLRLNFFDFRINIFKNYRNLPNGYDIIENERRLRLFGRISLPISVTVRTAIVCVEEPISFSEAEAIRLAGVRLRASVAELLRLGEMESLCTEGEWREGEYVFTLRYVQIRNIAKLQPIRLEEGK